MKIRFYISETKQNKMTKKKKGIIFLRQGPNPRSLACKGDIDAISIAPPR